MQCILLNRTRGIVLFTRGHGKQASFVLRRSVHKTSEFYSHCEQSRIPGSPCRSAGKAMSAVHILFVSSSCVRYCEIRSNNG